MVIAINNIGIKTKKVCEYGGNGAKGTSIEIRDFNRTSIANKSIVCHDKYKVNNKHKHTHTTNIC